MLNFNSIKMKNFITLLLSLTLTAVMAQNKDTQKADELYERMAYSDAADAYKKYSNAVKADATFSRN